MLTKDQAAAVASNIMLHLERMGEATDAERNKLIGSIIFETLSATVTKRPALTIDRNGRELTDLLCKAAGLDPRDVKSITARCEHRSRVTFEVTMFGDDIQIGLALAD